MKARHFIIASIVALPFLAACSDDDYNVITPAGNPQIAADVPAHAEMGQTVDFSVNCSDAAGKALSTLTAEMQYSGETVDQVVIRTREAGNYDVSLKAPFLRFIPNGKAQIVLTLQNVTTAKTVKVFDVDMTRPHFTDLLFVDDSKNKYPMTEDAEGNYNYTATIPIAKNTFRGHFETADGRFVFGSDGAEIALGGTGDLNLQSATVGNVEVTFNAVDFSYGPQEPLDVQPIEFADNEGGRVFTGELVQGKVYSFEGEAALTDADWFYDPDFFTKTEDNTYAFNAMTGIYTITADFTHKGFRIFAGTPDAPATLQADGTGAVWAIGSQGINKPTYDSVSQDWWTGIENNLCLAPIAEKTYQLTLVIGKQLNAGNVNFKFFGQPNWGTEFKGSGGDFMLTSTSDLFLVGMGKENNGHDDGNIFLADGASLTDGDTYVFTIDLTSGTSTAKLSVVKK